MAIDQDQFVRRLRDLRIRKGLTQDQAADLIGVHSRGYQFWEQGRHTPSLKSLEKIAAAFDVSTDFFMDPEEVPAQDRELQRRLGSIEAQLVTIQATLREHGQIGERLEAAIGQNRDLIAKMDGLSDQVGRGPDLFVAALRGDAPPGEAPPEPLANGPRAKPPSRRRKAG
jgi:transcriptional regulator with XRE-family HTH domain